MTWQFSRASVIGPAHTHSGLPNQDAVGLRRQGLRWVACVSDGMGSKPFSDIGSKTVVRTALDSLGIAEEGDKEFVTSLYGRWLKRIKPINPGDAAATCLVAIRVKSNLIRLFQLGDGVILYRSNGVVSVVSPPGNTFTNETTALGVSKKFSDWAITEVKLSTRGDGVILMSDGISEDLPQESLPDFMESLYQSLRKKSIRNRNTWLKRELLDWPTPGHSDDKSIAVIFRDK